MSQTMASDVGDALARYYAGRYGAELSFVVASIYGHFSAADTEFSEEAFRQWGVQAGADALAENAQLRLYYAARYGREEAYVEEVVFLTFARADTEFSSEVFWACFDREIDPHRDPGHKARRAELEGHFPTSKGALAPSGFHNPIRNLRRENEENDALAKAFRDKVSTYRCPYYADGQALRGVHPKSNGVVDALFETGIGNEG